MPLEVHNDVIVITDKSEVTALPLLDLSTTFDTIDHVSATLTNTIRQIDEYGISGQVQIYFFSHLKNRQ